MGTITSTNTEENEDKNGFRYPMEILTTLGHGLALPDYLLSLKREFIFMHYCHLNPKTGQVNGTPYIFENMTKCLVLANRHRNAKGAKLTLPRSSCGPGDYSFLVSTFKRLQFRICVRFAITAHKAQGQSFWRNAGNRSSRRLLF